MEKVSSLEKLEISEDERLLDSLLLEELEEDAELDKEITELRAQIQQLENAIEAERLEKEIGLNPKTGNISVDTLIMANATPEEVEEIQTKCPERPVRETVRRAVVCELNDKKTKSETSIKRTTVLSRLSRRAKKTLLALFVVGNFAAGASLVFTGKAKAGTYSNAEVKDLEDWEKIKLDQDDINKLENIRIVTEAHKNTEEKYLVVDKETGVAHLYVGDHLSSTYEVGTGQNVGDEQTVTVVADGKVLWDSGNKQTGAGIYTINKRGTYDGGPSWTLLNERKIEVPSALHIAVPGREKFFGNKNTKDNRMSNGCLNFMPESIASLAKQKDFGTGTKVYILPDDPHNKFEIIDGELRFSSNDKNVNRTTRPYEAKPIVLKAEGENETGKEFLEALVESKGGLMKLYPTISNDVYNQLTKTAYGIFGQESSFGTYGSLRGQSGRIADIAGAALGKNISAGVTQIRITSVNQKVRDGFGIKTTQDLFDTKKAATATMSLLLDIYTSNIPNDQKSRYEELVPFYYNNPKGSEQAIKQNEKTRSVYVKKVRENSKNVHVYNMVFQQSRGRK